MDNIFEILIYLFIAISIFSPLFKKKEQKPPPPVERKPERDQVYSSTQTLDTDEEEYDILKEIETLFKTDSSATPEIKEKQTAIEQKEAQRQTPIEKLQRKVERVKPAYEQAKTESEHKYTDWSRKVKVDDAISKKAAQFSEMMKRKKQQDVINDNVFRIRNKIKNPDTLKDYIIFSEILGKPKALKR